MPDIKTIRIDATGSALVCRTRLLGLAMVATAAAGRMTLRDGAADGGILVDLDVPASSGLCAITFPGAILAQRGVHATLTGITSVTLFYEG